MQGPPANYSSNSSVPAHNRAKVYELNAHTGRELWSYTTRAAIYSSPVVSDGTVYVGSNDGGLYALNAANGKKLWSYATGGGGRASG